MGQEGQMAGVVRQEADARESDGVGQWDKEGQMDRGRGWQSA